MAHNRTFDVHSHSSKPGFASSATCPSCKKQLPDEYRDYSRLAGLERDTSDCNTCEAIFQAATELCQQLKGVPGRLTFLTNPRIQYGIRAVDYESTFCADLNAAENCPDEDVRGAIGVGKQKVDIAQTFDTCRWWLEQCRAGHLRCQPFEAAYFPLRVLDLSKVDTTNLVFLVEHADKDDPVPGQYACLSHCWGDSQPVKTTKESQTHHMRDGITLQHLPLTFRDAVTVTRALGIDYLWIDSLCIIQDDDQDWQTQAAEMSAIYGSSAITIAATSAQGCHDGFLGGLRQSRQHISCQYGLTAPQSIVATEVPSHSSWQFGVTGDNVEKLPLQLRAWTLQEHILPTRILSFGNGEAVWACQSEMDCECGDVVIEASRFPDVNDKLNLKKWFSRTIAQLGKGSRLNRFWNSLICMYANRNLTYDTDRHVALQGIVELVRQRTNSTPCYGHWYGELTEMLRWVGSTNKCTIPAVWRAPTWSWLSLEYEPGSLRYSIDSLDRDNPFAAEILAIKGLSASEAVTSSQPEEWDSCPAGTLWLRAWAGDGVLRAEKYGQEPSARLVIPSLTNFVSNRFEDELHTDAFPEEDVEIKCIILGTGVSLMEMIICRQRSAGEPLARIGNCNYWDEDGEIRFHLVEHFVNDLVAIW